MMVEIFTANFKEIEGERGDKMGKVYLVGAGPGDPDLITVKGMKAIQASDVILYDRLVNKEILDFAKPHTKFFYCGKDPNKHSLPQEETNRMLVNLAKKGTPLHD